MEEKQHFTLGLIAGLAGAAMAVALMLAPGWDVPVAEAARAKVQRMTLQYQDFGNGSPASIFLRKDQGKAHLTPPGGDDSHGPIDVADDGTFSVEVDSGEDKIGSNTEIEVNGRKVEIHTSCSKPLGVGFLYGPDGDSTREDPGEFGPGGFDFALEVTALEFDQTQDLGDCLQAPTATPTPSPTDTPPSTATPTDTPPRTSTPTPTDTPPRTATPTPTQKRLVGDVNCLTPKPGDEKRVNSVDAAVILQFVAGLIDEVECPENADVHRDGVINALDAQLILQFTAGRIHRLD